MTASQQLAGMAAAMAVQVGAAPESPTIAPATDLPAELVLRGDIQLEAIAHVTRRNFLRTLIDQQACLTQLAKKYHLASGNARGHLLRLVRAGLITEAERRPPLKEGTEAIYYRAVARSFVARVELEAPP